MTNGECENTRQKYEDDQNNEHVELEEKRTRRRVGNREHRRETYVLEGRILTCVQLDGERHET